MHAIVTTNATINATIQAISEHVGDGCRQKLCIQNCGQNAAYKVMVTIDSIYELVIAVSNGTIANPLRRTI